jgi:hypothetical protein
VLEHIPNLIYKLAFNGIIRAAKKYILITVPYREKLKWNYARFPCCKFIFNGAYHMEPFKENDINFLFKIFECISLKKIVKILHPVIIRTVSLSS